MSFHHYQNLFRILDLCLNERVQACFTTGFGPRHWPVKSLCELRQHGKFGVHSCLRSETSTYIRSYYTNRLRHVVMRQRVYLLNRGHLCRTIKLNAIIAINCCWNLVLVGTSDSLVHISPSNNMRCVCEHVFCWVCKREGDIVSLCRKIGSVFSSRASSGSTIVVR